MKKMLWLIPLLLLGGGLLLTACVNKEEPLEEEGGFKNNTNYDAPKVIKSTEIVAFRCDFSMMDAILPEGDSELLDNAYILTAEWKDGAVTGRYVRRSRYYDKESYSFQAGPEFLDELQKLVAKHDLPQYNGLSYQVYGIPDEYGAELSIKYASGESVYASNNQSGFLPLAAMEALEELFRQQVEPDPAPLDLYVSEESAMENVDGCLLTVRYPMLCLGHLYWGGNGEGHEGLDEALSAYYDEILETQEALLRDTLRPAAEQRAGQEPVELYSLAEAYVTRSDDRVISSYETLTQCTGVGDEQYRVRTFSYDAKTGKKLTFEDVFTDIEYDREPLAELLASAFTAVEPALAAIDDLSFHILLSIQDETEVVCFALANGGVHFFADREGLGGLPGVVHVMLSYDDHPKLVKKYYRPAAVSWMTRLEYDMDYLLPGSISLCMESAYVPESEDLEWRVTVNGKALTETLYGQRPDCWLIHTGARTLLYMTEPRGDVEQFTKVYEIGAEGAAPLGRADCAMHCETNYNPERLLMASNDFVSSGNIMLMPCGVFRVGEDGLPTPAGGDAFALMGPTLRLKKAVEATAADPRDPNIENGPVSLEAGTKLFPFRTDKRSYVDFSDGKGKLYRFSIDGFTDDMNLSGFGTLAELLEPVSGDG